MALPYPKAYFDGKITDINQANLSVAGSAVLYGLSIYTVFHVQPNNGDFLAFRLADHFQRLTNSCKIIGIDSFSEDWNLEKFQTTMHELLTANNPPSSCLVRVSFHINDILPGTKSRGLKAIMSAFAYPAQAIVPSENVRLKTSVWRRTPDYSIPSRAKVNGAYINSVLARQDAIDSGYDDCIFLDTQGHVTELSAANIFIVRGDKLITPGANSDILEGINRKTVLELAKKLGIESEERSIDLTELYIADEIFVCGTSSFLSPVGVVDARNLPNPSGGKITKLLQEAYFDALRSPNSEYLTKL